MAPNWSLLFGALLMLVVLYAPQEIQGLLADAYYWLRKQDLSPASRTPTGQAEPAGRSSADDLAGERSDAVDRNLNGVPVVQRADTSRGPSRDQVAGLQRHA